MKDRSGIKLKEILSKLISSRCSQLTQLQREGRWNDSKIKLTEACPGKKNINQRTSQEAHGNSGEVADIQNSFSKNWSQVVVGTAYTWSKVLKMKLFAQLFRFILTKYNFPSYSQLFTIWIINLTKYMDVYGYKMTQCKICQNVCKAFCMDKIQRQQKKKETHKRISENTQQIHPQDLLLQNKNETYSHPQKF